MWKNILYHGEFRELGLMKIGTVERKIWLIKPNGQNRKKKKEKEKKKKRKEKKEDPEKVL